jgi:UDP-glucose 4-epimerase
MKKYLVVGGAGFIGSHLSAALCAEGADITIVDDFSLGNESNIRELLDSKKARLKKLDIGREGAAESVFAEGGPFDAVFHLAANSDIERSSKNPVIEYERTFMTTYRILEAMRLNGCKELVFCSTSAIYGDKSGRETAESDGPYLPISYYGGAKLASEGFISAYAHMNDMKAVVPRFPNVVGEHATHGVIYDFIKRLRENPRELRILGNGEQEKPYLYVKDLVDAILTIRSKAPERVAIYNIGAESRTKVKDIARIVVEEMGLKGVQFKFTGGVGGWKGDVPKFGYDLTRLHDLGWKAQHSSDEAVRLAARGILEDLK